MTSSSINLEKESLLSRVPVEDKVLDFTPTPVDEIPVIVERLRRGFESRARKNIQQRIDRLHTFLRMVNENEDLLVDALYRDLRKSRMEAVMSEIDCLRNDSWDAINNLADWTKPQHVHKKLHQKSDGVFTVADPLGVALIIGAWNYPIQLVFMPLIGAIAAGNTVLLKPSEIATRTAAVVTYLVKKYFSPDDIAVVNGGVAETSAVLNQRFDHIFYTGSGKVGRIIAAAAAKNLTPVVLELGGKSPVFIDSPENCDAALSARRVLAGKLFNTAQTCIAPDYVLVHEKSKDAFLKSARAAIEEFYGANPKESKDYGRIVSDLHFKRISSMIPNKDTDDEAEQKRKGQLVVGGQTDAATRYIAPTIILVDLQNADDTPCMQDEIFGPILPVLAVKSIQEAIRFINNRPKPLAMYPFSTKKEHIDLILDSTSAGGVTINDCLLHFTVDTLPFGGVGESGMGAYHGKGTFDVFSHRKAVCEKPQSMEFINNFMRYPPYTPEKLQWIKRFTLYEGSNWCTSWLPSFHTFLTFLFFAATVVLAVLFGLKKNC